MALQDRLGGAALPEAAGMGITPDRSRNLPAPRLAQAILLAALLSYLTITMLNILSAQLGPGKLVAALLGLAAIFLIQLCHSAPGANRAPAWRKWVTLTIQAVLTYLPMVAFRAMWGAMAGFLAGSLLLLLPARLAWTLYGSVGFSMLLPPLLDNRSTLDAIHLCQSSLLTGLVVYGLSRLSQLVREVHDTRDELARMAVTRERLRFARDLHDLLGYSLSSITLKSELIHRLIPAHPKRAAEEVADVLRISRQSLADVRRVASGFRDMSLREEVDSAQSVLSAADIVVQARLSVGALNQQVDTVLASVLREAVTNLLRHSQATVCEIEGLQQDGFVRLSVSNDGVDPGYHDPSPYSGSGLGNLEMRLRAVGGSLTSGRGKDGMYRLVAEAPVSAVRQLAAVDTGELPLNGPAA
ncbi:sensor histidine kinase [Streptomyces ovatisporus]|uniref:Sensor histidine kinase n=1 Tax=Streptomyces ovatisporus TaxID=1128682 RepID=A0ABV9AEA6_9ACTN